MDAASKTEAPTALRRRELREEGAVLKSSDVTAALAFLGALLILKLAGSYSLRRLLETSTALMAIPDLPSQSPHAMTTWLAFWLFQGLKAAIPLAAGCLLVGLAANFAQVGAVFTMRPLYPDANRLNPVTGLGRLFSKRSLVELLKALIKIALIGAVALGTLRAHVRSIMSLANMSPLDAGTTLAGIVFEVAARACVIFIIVAAIDYLYQRFEFEQKIKMTREEIREELKRTEGDPHIKARRRQRYRETIFQGVTPAIRDAKVVITNPTTYAVALKYHRRWDNAPVVVAKGRGVVAQRILQIADRFNIPVVSSPPLARALYRSVRLGHEIPPRLYKAVAEILVAIYRRAADSRRFGALSQRPPP